MRQIASIIHKPKLIITLSLIIAAIIGVFGYNKINQKPALYTPDTAQIESGSVPASKNLTLGFLASGRIKSVSVKTGDTVKKGQILASLDSGATVGALAQAKAAYETAKANYQKVINGATGTTIDVAKAAVHTAQVNLDQATRQQETLVANAYRNFLNSNISAYPIDSSSLTPPTISGSYSKEAQGSIQISVVQPGDSGYFTYSGIEEGTAKFSTVTPQALGSTGLFIKFPPGASTQYASTTWIIQIPNVNAASYLSNYNSYQAALQNQKQAVAGTQSALDQANASLASVVSAARPEDVAAAQAQIDNAFGALQVAQAAYANTIITAPQNGKITAIYISAGQIISSGAPAMELLTDVQ